MCNINKYHYPLKIHVDTKMNFYTLDKQHLFKLLYEKNIFNKKTNVYTTCKKTSLRKQMSFWNFVSISQ